MSLGRFWVLPGFTACPRFFAALGISGVTLCVLLLYLLPSPTYAGAETFGPASDFLANPDTPRFMAIIIGASVCNGLFLVPLQAMAQRRSNPNIRAQLMSDARIFWRRC